VLVITPVPVEPQFAPKIAQADYFYKLYQTLNKDW